MIVQCDKCKTKFRIADSKVTANGVKVRCSRCAHVFIVRASSAASTEAPGSPGSSQDELARALRDLDGGQASPATSLGSSLPGFPRSSPGSPAFASPTSPSALPLSAASRLDFATYAPVAPDASFAPGYPIPSAVPEAAPSARGPEQARGLPVTLAPEDARIALGFSSAPTEAETLVTKAQGASSPTEASTLAAALAEASRARFDASPAGGPGFDDAPTATYHALGPLLESMAAKTGELAPTQPAAEIHDTTTRRLQLPGVPGLTIPAKPGEDPFASLFSGFSAADLAPNPRGSPDPKAPDPRAATSPGTLHLTVPAGAASATASNAGSSMLARSATNPTAAFPPGIPKSATNPFSNPFASSRSSPSALDAPLAPSMEPSGVFFPPPPDLAGLLATAQAELGGSEPSSSAGDLGDIPGLLPPAGAPNDDPFADLDLDGPVFTGSGYAENGLEPTPFSDERSTFSPLKSGPPAPTGQAPLGRIDLAKTAAVQAPPTLAATRVSSSLPLKRPPIDVRPTSGDAYGRWPTLLGVGFGLSVTILAVMGPAEGHLSRFGPDTLAALVSTPMTQPIFDAISEVSVRRAHVTSYETRSGKSLLVVAGDATNEAKAALEELVAVATIYDGTAVVGRREAIVGVKIGEDALTAVSSAEDLRSASTAAIAHTPPEARVLKAGATLPFMVVFPEVPSDIAQRTFFVEFRPSNRTPSPRAP